MDLKTWKSPAANTRNKRNPRSLSPKMKEEVRRYLMKYAEWVSMEMHRQLLKHHWATPTQKLRTSATLKPYKLHTCCHQTTALYSSVGRGTLRLACIFKEWFLQHNGRPNIEYNQFVANLQEIHPTKGPQSINNIISLHNSICDQALALIDHIQSDRGRQSFAIGGGEGRRNAYGPWTNPDDYRINPIYTAIFMVLDELPDIIREARDGYDIIDITKHSQRQSVLLVRTGRESKLSAPISFDELRTSGKCILGSRAYTDDSSDDGSPDMVRVSIDTAVKFVAELERRENTVVAKRVEEFTHYERTFAENELEMWEGKDYSNSIVGLAIKNILAANHCEEVWSQRWKGTNSPFSWTWI